MTTLQDYAYNLCAASGDQMKAATIAYAVLTARAMLTRDNPARIDPHEARLAVEALDKVSKKALTDGAKAQFSEETVKNEHTIANVVNTFPKVHATLEKMYGKASGTVAPTVGDDGANGERTFWQAVLYEPDHVAMVAFVLSQFKSSPSPHTGEYWDGTWSGLRAYVGFKSAPKKSANVRFAAAVKRAIKDVDDDSAPLNVHAAVFGFATEATESPGVLDLLEFASNSTLADLVVAINKTQADRRERTEAVETLREAA